MDGSVCPGLARIHTQLGQPLVNPWPVFYAQCIEHFEKFNSLGEPTPECFAHRRSKGERAYGTLFVLF